MKRTLADREDLIHILTISISEEGYEIDTTIEREIVSLAKLIINRHNLNEDDMNFEDDESDDLDPFDNEYDEELDFGDKE